MDSFQKELRPEVYLVNFLKLLINYDKTKSIIPIHKVSNGRWIFKGKKFNKLSDINWRFC